MKKLIFSALFILTTLFSFSQGAGCSTADPFCTGSVTTFPAGVNGLDANVTAPGNNYGCLFSQPNPAWYYMEISSAGNMTIDINNSGGNDIDFALWGPFPDYPTAVGNCGMLSIPYDCSYSGIAVPEVVTITGASVGDVYILLITNYSNLATNVSFTNSSGAAATNCLIINPCIITSLTSTPSPCNPANDTYSVSGGVTFTDPPTTGTLTVTDCHGNNQVFNSPFVSPINYNIGGINADGSSCNVTAVFSADPLCTFTSNYTSPVACSCATTFSTDLITACDNHTWIDGVNYVTSNNTSTVTLVNTNGCDSTVTLDLTINNSTTSTDVITACNNYTWIDGNTYTSSNNTSTVTLVNANGCDSTVTLDLTIDNFTTGIDIITDCDNHTWIDGNNYNVSNNTSTFTITGGSYNGCDSIVTLDLTINNSTTSTDVITACDTYTWIDGNTYTVSNNTSAVTLVNTNGCDSIVTLDLTINNSTTSTDVITACDTYTWIDGNTYTSSNNTAFVVLTNANGCDSTVTLDLTIDNFTTGIDVITACDTYTWIDGNTYTVSNNTSTFTITGGSYNGCDSIVTLDLTINNTINTTDVITACDTYTWIDGNTYTVSNNTSSITLISNAGCDSIVTLDLTINNSTTSTDTQVSCDTYTWIDGNTYLTSNNTAFVVLANTNGCDSTITLDLTINNSTTTVLIDSICIDQLYTFVDGTILPINFITNHISILNDMNGCDSIIDMTVSPLPTSSSIEHFDICIGSDFTFPDGYLQTNVLVNTSHISMLQNINGCDSVVTTDLTILPQFNIDIYDTICYNTSYVFIDGTIQSNIITPTNYTSTLVSAGGCDSLVTENIYLNPEYNINEIYTQCPGFDFTFPDGIIINNINSNTTHISNLSTTNGCDSTITTDVNIFNIPAFDITLTPNGCSPLDMTITNNTFGINSVWNISGPGFNNSYSGSVISDTYINDGSYDITLSMETIDGCQIYTDMNNAFLVYPLPYANFNWDPLIGNMINNTINFNNLTIGGMISNWTFGDSDTSFVFSPSHTYQDTGSYPVELIVENQYGCKDTTDGVIRIDDTFLMYIPNSFSPLDENGINDIFYPIISGEKINSYSMMIFNRWGEVIFETHNLERGWDGTYKGKLVQNDMYIVHIEVDTFNNLKKVYNGNVYVIR